MAFPIETLTVRVAAETTQYRSALAGAAGYTKSFSSAVVQSAQGAADAIAAIAVPIAAVGTASAVGAARFERTGAQIVGLAGATTEEVARMSQAILAMAPAVGRAPQELIEAMYFLQSSGVKGAAAIEAVEMAARAASAGMGDTSTIAKVLAASLNAYSKTGLTAIQATDALVAAVREGSAEAGSLLAPIGRLIPMASTLGVSFNEILGPLAAITRTGSSAAEAGVSLQGFLTTLMKPSRQASAQLAAVGLSMADLREVVKGPNGVVTAMRVLDQAFGGDVEAMNEVFGNIRPLRGVLSLLTQDGAKVDEVLRNVRNAAGSLGTAFNAVSGKAGFKFDQFMAQLKVTLIEFGGTVLGGVAPILASLTESLRAVTVWWKGLEESTRKTIVTWGMVVVAAGAAVIVIKMVAGVLAMLGLGQLTSAALWTLWTAAVWVAKVAMVAFNVACLVVNSVLALLEAALTGVGLVAAAAQVVALGAALTAVGIVLYSLWHTAKAVFSLLTSLPTTYGPIKAVGDLFRGWGPVLSEIWQTLQVDGVAAWKIAGAAAVLFFNRVRDVAVPTWNFLRDGFDVVWELVAATFKRSMFLSFSEVGGFALKFGKMFGIGGDLAEEFRKEMTGILAGPVAGANSPISQAQKRLEELIKNFQVIPGDATRASEAGLQAARESAEWSRLLAEANAELDEAFGPLGTVAGAATAAINKAGAGVGNVGKQARATRAAMKDLKLDFVDFYSADALARVEDFREAVSPSIRGAPQGTSKVEDYLRQIAENTKGEGGGGGVEIKPGDFTF